MDHDRHSCSKILNIPSASDNNCKEAVKINNRKGLIIEMERELDIKK